MLPFPIVILQLALIALAQFVHLFRPDHVVLLTAASGADVAVGRGNILVKNTAGNVLELFDLQFLIIVRHGINSFSLNAMEWYHTFYHNTITNCVFRVASRCRSVSAFGPFPLPVAFRPAFAPDVPRAAAVPRIQERSYTKYAKKDFT